MGENRRLKVALNYKNCKVKTKNTLEKGLCGRYRHWLAYVVIFVKSLNPCRMNYFVIKDQASVVVYLFNGITGTFWQLLYEVGLQRPGHLVTSHRHVVPR